jgi:hypothetical protein
MGRISCLNEALRARAAPTQTRRRAYKRPITIAIVLVLVLLITATALLAAKWPFTSDKITAQPAAWQPPTRAALRDAGDAGGILIPSKGVAGETAIRESRKRHLTVSLQGTSARE